MKEKERLAERKRHAALEAVSSDAAPETYKAPSPPPRPATHPTIKCQLCGEHAMIEATKSVTSGAGVAFAIVVLVLFVPSLFTTCSCMAALSSAKGDGGTAVFLMILFALFLWMIARWCRKTVHGWRCASCGYFVATD